MAARWIAVGLTLGLSACLIVSATPSPGPSVTGWRAGLTPDPEVTDEDVGRGRAADRSGAQGVATPALAAPAATKANLTATPSTAPAATPAPTPATDPAATPATTPDTTSATSATTRAPPTMAPRVPAPATTPATNPATPAREVSERAAADRTGTVVFLLLLLILLFILLFSAWWKLHSYGGSGSYYPGRSDKRLYVCPEEGEASDGGPGSAGRAFLAAVSNLLPRKPPREQVEGCAGEEPAAERGPGGGGSEGGGPSEEGEEEQKEEAPEDQDEESGQSDSDDDYSSLGGLDLRARASLDGGSREEEGILPGPTSPAGDELLSELHSFSGTASWTDTNHDITAL